MGLLPWLLAARRSRANRRLQPSSPPALEQRPAGLSVVMAAHNERQTLAECLTHLDGLADEIVVVDAASSDGSAEVAASFTEHVIETTNKAMLEINKNLAMAAATREWVLVLDPDERLSASLRRQIREVVDGDGDDRLAGYWMPRRNYILGSWMRTMGMYPASQLRLVRNGLGRFSEVEHHLPMSIEGPTGHLSGDLIHLSDATVGEIIQKRTRYAEFAAQQMHENGVRPRASRLVIAPLGSFASQYILLGGFLEGVRGLIYAALSAYGAFLRNVRLWELQGERRRGE
jgi:glycosyltransferase involved in cell wall biosynthesis